MENKNYYTIQAILQKDGYYKVSVLNYGVTWAKSIEDIGIAVSELIQVTEQRKENFIKLIK